MTHLPRYTPIDFEAIEAEYMGGLSDLELAAHYEYLMETHSAGWVGPLLLELERRCLTLEDLESILNRCPLPHPVVP